MATLEAPPIHAGREDAGSLPRRYKREVVTPHAGPGAYGESHVAVWFILVGPMTIIGAA
jgi:hypothetical protein